MITILTTLLANQYVQALIVGGAGWVASKIAGKHIDNKAAKVAALLATCASLMTQYVITEPNKTPEQVKTALKGIVAIQFAAAGIYEEQRALFQPLIDKAISAGLEQWVKLHPNPSSLTMPITKQLEMRQDVAAVVA